MTTFQGKYDEFPLPGEERTNMNTQRGEIQEETRASYLPGAEEECGTGFP